MFVDCCCIIDPQWKYGTNSWGCDASLPIFVSSSGLVQNDPPTHAECRVDWRRQLSNQIVNRSLKILWFSKFRRNYRQPSLPFLSVGFVAWRGSPAHIVNLAIRQISYSSLTISIAYEGNLPASRCDRQSMLKTTGSICRGPQALSPTKGVLTRYPVCRLGQCYEEPYYDLSAFHLDCIYRA
jgi:hypothetical protein